MELSLKKRYSYKNTILFLSIMCALSAVGCSLLGYIMLPFAASLYATLLLYESKEKRIISYVLPVIMFVINFALNGLLSLEAVAYVIIGVVVYLSYVKKRSKAEGAFIATIVLLLLILISALLFGVYHGNLVQGTYGFVMGILFTIVYEKYKNFYLPVIMHALANLVGYCIQLNGFI